MSGFSLVHSRALMGLRAVSVQVEVHLASGLPSFNLVGLADTEVKEARERVRSAIANCGLEFPHSQRITVNLAPADLPKDSGRFDLPIAVGILAASGQIDQKLLDRYEFAGELSLSGEIRSVKGSLALALSMALHQKEPLPFLVLPEESAQEAALVPDCQVIAVKHLLDLIAQFAPARQSTSGSAKPQQTRDATDMPPAQPGWRLIKPIALPKVSTSLDMSEVKAQQAAKRALEIAAAGGHSVLMIGAPGTGKSMLAQRFASILPPLQTQEALESAAVQSLAGQFKREHWGQRAFQAPHHTASAVALVGGGSPPRPGEISLAHHGVLFLDELPEFARAALEALREPLETGVISIARATQRSEFPSRFQLIAAMNPCPCGYLGSQHKACRCSPDQVLRYQSKISGPLLDRIDMHIEVSRLEPEELLEKSTVVEESSATIAQRVQAARERSLNRQGSLNCALQGKALEQHIELEEPARKFLNAAAARLGWSGRAIHRSLRLARSIADLQGSEHVRVSQIAEAIQYRRALRSGV